MRIETYKKYVEMLKHDFAPVIKEAQEKLNKSNSKNKDKEILQDFWNVVTETIGCDWEAIENYEEMLNDSNAIMPMPESVSKQMSIAMFDIKHLNPLFDMPINEGFY